MASSHSDLDYVLQSAKKYSFLAHIEAPPLCWNKVHVLNFLRNGFERCWAWWRNTASLKGVGNLKVEPGLTPDEKNLRCDRAPVGGRGWGQDKNWNQRTAILEIIEEPVRQLFMWCSSHGPGYDMHCSLCGHGTRHFKSDPGSRAVRNGGQAHE